MTWLFIAVGPIGGETAAPAEAKTGVLVAIMICVGVSSTGVPEAFVIELGGMMTKAVAVGRVGTIAMYNTAQARPAAVSPSSVKRWRQRALRNVRKSRGCSVTVPVRGRRRQAKQGKCGQPPMPRCKDRIDLGVLMPSEGKRE